MSYNRATLVGNLGADPEIRRLNNGNPAASLRLATSERWRDKQSGERRERTEWHSVVIFSEGLCKVVQDYCRKGSKVLVEGKIQTRKWQAQDGSDRYSTEIVLNGFDAKLVLLDSSGGGRPPAPSDDSYGADGATTQQRSAPPAAMRDAMDDDIPFAPEVR